MQKPYQINNVALILASGSGSRFESKIPKQYTKIAGEMILTRTIKKFLYHPLIDQIKVVINQKDLDLYLEAVSGLELLDHCYGGDTRQDSVAQGILSLDLISPQYVLIHDGCRPLLSENLISSLINASPSNDVDCIFPMIPIYSSLKQRQQQNKFIDIDRNNIFIIQTPQMIKYNSAKDLYQRIDLPQFNDESSLFEHFGYKLISIEGEQENIKITTQNDKIMAERLLNDKYEIRTGIGFDAHRFKENQNTIKEITLGGIKIPHNYSLEAHSDGDVVLHALVDALLGAASLGDIGEYFPPSNDKWKNANSSIFVEHVLLLLNKENYQINNIDITIIAEEPKISPYKIAMANKIAEILKIDQDRINVKATTTEKMGFTGRKEGIAVQAIATLKKYEK